MNKQEEDWRLALAQVCRLLGPLQPHVPVGGSCGSVLQGVAIHKSPRDLDMYYDRSIRSQVRERLIDYEVMAPHDNETDRYRSTLSHYQIGGSTVELVGGFQVNVLGSRYQVEVEGWVIQHSPVVEVGGILVRLMPLAHEFVFNVLRERADRVEAIAQVMRADAATHQHVLRDLLSRHRIARVHRSEMEAQLDWQLF